MPSDGRVSTRGALPLSRSADHLGPMLYGQGHLSFSRTGHAGLDRVLMSGSFDDPFVFKLPGDVAARYGRGRGRRHGGRRVEAARTT